MKQLQALPSPISTLPSEILIRIFLLAIDSRPCPFGGNRYHYYKFAPVIPKHPDSFLLVCRHWHSVAIASRSLWAHIDVLLSRPQAEPFLARAGAYVSRAQQTALDVHIMDPGTRSSARYYASWVPSYSDDNSSGESEDDDEDDSLDSFRLNLEKIDCLGPAHEPTPIRTLELVAHGDYHMSQLVALQSYLSKCAPGTLKHLLIRTQRPDDEPLGHFIEYGYVGDSLDVPTEDLEKSLSSVTTLYLDGLYPYWTSQAYSRLTDLYLGGGIDIPEQDLIEILRSSPGIRTLRLNCRVIDTTAQENEHGEYDEEPPFDVHLKDLEILDIHSLNYSSSTRLLRRLSYASKLLRLCLSEVDRSDDISHFLSRSENSNVTELRVTYGKLDDLHDYTERYTSLRTLVIGQWNPDGPKLAIHTGPLHWYTPGDKSFGTRLDTLYVIRMSISYEELRAMVDYYGVRRLVLWQSSVNMSDRSGESTSAHVAALCSVVDVIKSNHPNPVEK